MAKEVTVSFEHLIKHVSKKTDFNNNEVRKILQAYHHAITEGLITADRVRIDKVCMLYPKWRRATMRSMIGQGMTMRKPSWGVRFKPCKYLTEAIKARRKAKKQ